MLSDPTAHMLGLEPDKIRKEHGGSRRRRLLEVLLQLGLPHVMVQAWRVMRHDATEWKDLACARTQALSGPLDV